MVKPEFWSDEVTGELVDPGDPALFYIGLWQMCDDTGYFKWTAKEAAAFLYPFLGVRERMAAVEANMARLVKAKRVRLFKCGHGVIPSYTRHQRFVAAYRKSSRIQSEHVAHRAGPRSPAVDRFRPQPQPHSTPASTPLISNAHAQENENGTLSREQIQAFIDDPTISEAARKAYRKALSKVEP